MSDQYSQKKWLSLILSLVFLWVVSPLLLPVIMGGVLAIVVMPGQSFLNKKGMPSGLSSAFLTLGVTLLVLLPVGLVVFYVAKTGLGELQHYRAGVSTSVLANPILPFDAETLVTQGRNQDFFTTFLGNDFVQKLIEQFSKVLPISKESIFSSIREVVLLVGAKMAELLGGLISAIPSIGMGVVVMILALYFFLMDGGQCLGIFRRLSRLEVQQTEKILHQLEVTCRSVVLASLLAGFIQGLISSVGCLLTSTPNGDIIGVLVFLGSFIPLVGSLPITLGVALHQLILGHTTQAFWLFVIAGVVAASDNLVRPLFLRGTTNLHPLMAFIAALGGIQVMGFFGIFLGPILASAFLVSLELIQERSSV